VRLEQQSHPEVVDAGVIADDRQALGAARDQCLDQVLRDTGEAEAACGISVENGFPQLAQNRASAEFCVPQRLQ
jgi:hypothetical protein